MKRLFWGLCLAVWFVACATTDSIDGTTVVPDAGHVDPKPEGGAGRPDGGTDVVTKPDASPTDSSFVAPAPIITAITPTKAIAGGVGPTLSVSGDSFVSWSVVRADGADLPTTFVSETELRAQLPASRIEDAGVVQIDVFTTAPGGGKSANIGFLVENPMPVLTSMSPSSVQIGATDLVLTLNGTNFAKNPSVAFDGVGLTVLSATPTMITATVPTALMSSSGSYSVKVSNPAPGGGLSATIAFIVTNPQSISVTSVSPTSAIVGSGDITLTIDGSGFVNGESIVSFNGVNVPSTVSDQSRITATVPAALLATSGSFPVVVTNPPPGGGVSSPVQFEVRNPAPTLTTLSPNTAVYGGSDRKIAVLGTGFVPTSVVRVVQGTPAPVTTTFVSPNELEATIPAAKLAALGTLGVQVQSPGPGGGTSGTLTLFVMCDPSGVDVALGPAGSMTTLFTEFSSAPTVAALNAGACPTTLNGFLTPQPHRAWVVQNNQPNALTLSAWAVCTSGTTWEDDALMAIYKRATAPATNDERLQCATVMAEGDYPFGYSYKSPESNGSKYCPGLTKQNGGGVELAACERAVVFTQPYSMTNVYFTPPYSVRVKVE